MLLERELASVVGEDLGRLQNGCGVLRRQLWKS